VCDSWDSRGARGRQSVRAVPTPDGALGVWAAACSISASSHGAQTFLSGVDTEHRGKWSCAAVDPDRRHMRYLLNRSPFSAKFHLVEVRGLVGVGLG